MLKEGYEKLPKSVADPGGGSRRSRPPPPSDLTLVWDGNFYMDSIVYHFLSDWFFFNEMCVAFCHLSKFQGYWKMQLFWDTLRLCSQSSISRANGDRRSQIEKHVVVSAFSATGGRGCGGVGLWGRRNLPQKNSTVLSETKFGHPTPPRPPQRCYSEFGVNQG